MSDRKRSFAEIENAVKARTVQINKLKQKKLIAEKKLGPLAEADADALNDIEEEIQNLLWYNSQDNLLLDDLVREGLQFRVNLSSKPKAKPARQIAQQSAQLG